LAGFNTILYDLLIIRKWLTIFGPPFGNMTTGGRCEGNVRAGLYRIYFAEMHEQWQTQTGIWSVILFFGLSKVFMVIQVCWLCQLVLSGLGFRWVGCLSSTILVGALQPVCVRIITS